MSVPSDLKYTKEHEWVRVNGNVGRIGITRFAVDHLGDIVYVDLPAIGKAVKQFDVMSSIESVKAVSDIYAPASGKVMNANSELAGKPEQVNADPYGQGWMVEISISNPAELSALLSPSEYESHIREKK